MFSLYQNHGSCCSLLRQKGSVLQQTLNRGTERYILGRDSFPSSREGMNNTHQNTHNLHQTRLIFSAVYSIICTCGGSRSNLLNVTTTWGERLVRLCKAVTGHLKNKQLLLAFLDRAVLTPSGKWNESGFRPFLCTHRLNWARRTSWG